MSRRLVCGIRFIHFSINDLDPLNSFLSRTTPWMGITLQVHETHLEDAGSVLQ
ncbi:hypothetical protein TSMEX_000673 [Taenia solium]|eukprot:TsM_000826100 transcript=TsM_000826100 gene=TsM_000826100